MFFWPLPDAVRFTLLLREAYGAVKSVDPAMPVISGGIAGSPASGMVPLGEGDRPFLAAIYAAGASGYMDAIAAHPYPISFNSDGSQTPKPAAMEQFLGRLRSVPVMLLMSLEDQSAGTSDVFNGINAGIGVLDSKGAPKPAACASSALLDGSLSC